MFVPDCLFCIIGWYDGRPGISGTRICGLMYGTLKRTNSSVVQSLVLVKKYYATCAAEAVWATVTPILKFYC